MADLLGEMLPHALSAGIKRYLRGSKLKRSISE
jgi:hypothetical protein